MPNSMLTSLEPFDSIIFDLGGVILDIDFQKTINEFQKIGFHNFTEAYNYFKAQKVFEDFELGRITPEDFRDGIKQYLNNNTSDEAIDRAWNAMIVDIPSIRIQILEKIAKKYRVFLLSNTNEIHYHCYNRILFERTGYKNLSEVMEKDYYSHLIGYKKPYPEAYKYVLDQHSLNPQHTVFVDDLFPNIEAAQKLGMKTIHFKEHLTMEETFMEI